MSEFDFYMTESDVCSSQTLTYKDSHHTERIKMFIIVVDPYLRYSNEAERVNKDIYDYFKLKKPLSLQ